MHKCLRISLPGTYDHRVWKTGLPVRSAVLKPHAGRLVVGWVTTSESQLLYVLFPIFQLQSKWTGPIGWPTRGGLVVLLAQIKAWCCWQHV